MRHHAATRPDLARVCLLCAALAIGVLSGCAGERTIAVSLVFETAWTAGGEVLPPPERTMVRQEALETLRSAYRPFAIEFGDGTAARRIVRIRDTPSKPLGGMALPAAGMTYAAATVSTVWYDVLLDAELAAAGCSTLADCSVPRDLLLKGLGRGIGATAAHELGHQAGFRRFTLDSRCDDCFDGGSTGYLHFFGSKHWSPAAMSIMEEVLPARLR